MKESLLAGVAGVLLLGGEGMLDRQGHTATRELECARSNSTILGMTALSPLENGGVGGQEHQHCLRTGVWSGVHH